MPYDDSPPPTRRARPLSVAAALAAVCLTAAGCGGGQEPGEAGAASPRPGGDAATSTAPTGEQPEPTASASPSAKPLPKGPLTGRTVVIDPGHNPGNRDHTREINRQVDIGTGRKECDTTGTATNDGYAEARFTLDVSHRLRALLEAEGARVRLTHDADRPFGPCIDERARIGNEAKADAVVSVHADGSAVGNRGFHVILPAGVKGGGADTSKIVKSSADLGARIAGHFARTTGSAPSNYIGGNTGLNTRDDLGGLNLSTVPKVFVECGNMRDPKDAALLTSASWRQKAAQGLADGITSYLKG
ncbi:N-acetylmuramoyl-L-alanine amidase [Streptomyces parvus]|uniref:N-acetylmuramoyl-L-alanine amidase n=1 Tax=Streptomyces parvus TaxID=66428 RepID=UPI00123B07D3|nr:N-acetylmuramoyl-L-alanine amidase [Streptomyces parvus]KAA6202525.1 N-acetylmuramoyl-L-alanine amidase [Streptomyces parvus]GGS19683.1 N-acetylmuramoyl-L-alanine amidase [Streptomyces parvus]